MIQQSDSMDQILEKPAGLSRRSKILLGTVLLLLLSLIPLWPALQRWSRADESVDLARLRTATVVRGDLVRDVVAEGRIVAANHPRLYSPAEGTVSLTVRPSFLWRLMRRVRSRDDTSEMATPSRPARAVRPMRWT